MRFGRCLLISFLRGLLINHGTPPAPAVTQSNPIAPFPRTKNYGRLTHLNPIGMRLPVNQFLPSICPENQDRQVIRKQFKYNDLCRHDRDVFCVCQRVAHFFVSLSLIMIWNILWRFDAPPLHHRKIGEKCPLMSPTLGRTVSYAELRPPGRSGGKRKKSPTN